MEKKRVLRSNFFNEFFNSEKAGGLILLIATIISLTITNLSFGHQYYHFWHKEIFGASILHWVNDGLMVIFFLLVGLELKREIFEGELSNIKKASLPVIAAFGGMIIPATIYALINIPTGNFRGAGIPMATDIAFAIGVLSLAGKRVSMSLKIFLTALAVIDDLGAILVIALFYSKTLNLLYLGGSLLVALILFAFNRLKINKLFVYIIGGILMWYLMLNSGVHSTIAGVILAFLIPTSKDKSKRSLSENLEHRINKPVAFIILPIFALANTSIIINAMSFTELLNYNDIGIMAGLLLGKPIGILLFSYLGIKMKICALPDKLHLYDLIGVSILGGIGFTMSIFITFLAFDTSLIMIDSSKIAIISSSTIAGIIGYFWLILSNKKHK